MRRKSTYWIRRTAYFELYAMYEGGERGFDGEYMGTYETEAEARAVGERIAAAPPGTAVDLENEYTLTVP